MSFDLTNKNIQDTFQNLLQRTGSNNHLYDLTGNEIGDLRISGSLYANEYIVSSSVTNIITIAKSGSTQFGDSSDDTHFFNGHITASGNISSSGKITANEAQFGSDSVHINGVAGQITASGNITASGIIYGGDFRNQENNPVVFSKDTGSFLQNSITGSTLVSNIATGSF